jgi:hypothetical protein
MPRSATPLAVYDNRPSLRTRLAALALSLGVVALMLATLIAMGMLDTLPGRLGERLTAITMSSSSQDRQKQQQETKTSKSAAPQVSQAVIPVPRPLPRPPIISVKPPVSFIPMSKADMAAADISKLGRQSGSAPAAQSMAPAKGRAVPSSTRPNGTASPRMPSSAAICQMARRQEAGE